MIEYLENLLTSKWGTFTHCDNAICNGNLPYSEGVMLNYIFDATDVSEILECAANYNFALPSDLIQIYRHCNGMRLFLSGLSIFGVQRRNHSMEPYSISAENHNIHMRMKNNGCDTDALFFFGSYAKDCVLAINKSGQYLCIKNGESVPVLIFTTLKELMEFFIPRIASKYDSNCFKMVPNEKYKSIPVFANSMLRIEEIYLPAVK